MLVICSTIESVVQFLSGGGIKLDMDSVYDFFTGKSEAILLKGWENAGIIKDQDKWVIFLPIETEENDFIDNFLDDDLEWIKEWEEFREKEPEHKKKFSSLMRTLNSIRKN